MRDEIKQMIDNLKFISEQESATIEINQNGCKVILDCITNLQEGNHNLLQEVEYMQNKNNELVDDKESWQRVAQKNYNEMQDRLDTLKIEISGLMNRYFYEEDFYIEDTHLDKLLRIIDGDNILEGDEK